jgi:hypothetical protein
MPKAFTEFFNGGLVTARHPALLNPGELQRADDCVYREKDPSIWRAPGRTNYGTAVASSAVLGLGYLPFENGRTSKVIAYAGATLYSLSVYDTASGLIGAGATGAQFTSTELGGPGITAGTCATVASHTDFTSSDTTSNFTTYPFLASIVGARVFGTTLNGLDFQVVVTAVKAQDGTTGHYSTVTLKKLYPQGNTVTATFGTTPTTLAFQFGFRQSFPQDGANTRNNIFDFVQYGSSYFAQFGVNLPRKIEYVTPSAIATDIVLTSRPCGLRPVTVFTTANVVAVSGAIGSTGETYGWKVGLGFGYYWFLITEIFVLQDRSASDGAMRDVAGSEVESGYLPFGANSQSGATPVSVSIPNITTGVRINLPAVTNVGDDGRIATHWGIYMSATHTVDSTSPPALSTFVRIARPPIKTLAAGADSFGNAGTYEVYESTGSRQMLFAVSATAAAGHTTFTNDSAMVGVAAGPSSANCGRSRSNSGANGSDTVAAETFLAFTIDAAGGNATRIPTGMQISVFGRGDSSGDNQQHADGYFYPVVTATGKQGIQQNFRFGTDKYIYTQTRGGPGDTFGATWPALASMTTFGIVIGQGANSADMGLWIDSVRLILYSTSQNINLNGKPFKTVVYRDQIGTTLNEQAYGLPAACSTMCFHQGMLITNDISESTSDSTVIRYSLPGYPEYFPQPYALRLNVGKRRDVVTALMSLGTVLLVGLSTRIERVNYLPRENATDLDDGLAHEELAGDHGIAGPLALVKFDMPGQGTIVAYASAAGLMLTNGIWIQPLNMDLDWGATVKRAALSTAVFRVYPQEKWLVFYYCPAGATHNRNTRALVFHYQQDKIKQGGYLPCTGPLTVSGRASCEIQIDGAHALLTGHETTGVIYREDDGVAQATSYQVHNASDSLTTATIQPLVRSRKLFGNGIERDAREERILLLMSNYGVAITSSVGTTSGSTTITAGSSVATWIGQRITGTGIVPGTIVISQTTSTSAVLSQAATATATITATLDTGTVSLTVRGSGSGEAVFLMDTAYVSTLTGDLVTAQNDNSKQALELQIEKVVLPNAASVDLGTNMRLHQFTFLLNDGGLEQHGSSA